MFEQTFKNIDNVLRTEAGCLCDSRSAATGALFEGGEARRMKIRK
jgi:hypothetical protein